MNIPERFNLVTFHRQENVDNKENLENIVKAINDINLDTPIIFPIHPRTKKMLDLSKLSFKLHRDLSLKDIYSSSGYWKEQKI